jgi:peroxiredoxin Q/BCP
MTIEIGAAAPEFSMKATGGRTVSSAALKGKPFVLYFYPKADTPGCTKEACGFEEALPGFGGDVTVIGVSKDSLKVLESFATKYKLTFPLASDADGEVIKAFGAWGEKSMYGKKYMGIERSTVLVDAAGRIAALWPKVKVAGHAAEVGRALQALG